MNIDEMPAGREMDALVAERVMGWKFKPPEGGAANWCQNCGRVMFAEGDGCEDDCFYSTDIASAWEVVEKMHVALHPHGEYDVDKDEIVWSGDWIADAETYDRGDTWFEQNSKLWTRANTAPLAICRAALKAAM